MSTATDGRVAQGQAQAWVKIKDEAEMKAARASHPYSRGFVPGMGRLLASHPRIGPAFGTLYHEIMFAEESHLTRREREMVAAAATAAQDCFY